MTWATFFAAYGIIGLLFAVVLSIVLHRNSVDHEDGDGFSVVLTSLFWLPWLALVLLAWGWLTLDEVLSRSDA